MGVSENTLLDLFGIKNPEKQGIQRDLGNGFDMNPLDFEPSPNISVETFRLIVESLWEKIQDGLTLSDIENILFVIIFVRFAILAIRYNLKTSFYITMIGLAASFFWMSHLATLVSNYRVMLLNLPFLHKLGVEAFQSASIHRQMALTDLKLGEQVHWYNPGQMIYYGFTKGIVHVDPESGLRYYIDPISMLVSNLRETTQSKILPIYYKIYNKVIPKIYKICTQFWNQLSGVAAYVIVSRLGKRYCPYLIRWHWTFLLIIGMVEQVLISFVNRLYYFQLYVLIPQINEIKNYEKFKLEKLMLQINVLDGLLTTILLCHIGFIIFGLFHSIWGQYFYLPFFVENTELHIGPRSKESIYSGGQTAWQDPEEKTANFKGLVPKLWYGWFGRGTRSTSIGNFNEYLKKILKKLKKFLKKLRKKRKE